MVFNLKQYPLKNFYFQNKTILINKMKEQLQRWLEQLETKTIKDDKYSILILGKSGSGRTTMVKDFFKDNEYYLHEINSNNCQQKKYLTEVMNKIIEHRHSFFFDSNKKHALLIDELDGISMTEKGSLNEIIDIIKKVNKDAKMGIKYPIPIICIGNENYLKKKNDLEKICKVLIMKDPDSNILMEIVVEWAKSNKIKLSKSVLELQTKCV
jgi:Cdc6-like AAA superfamily ATPase